LENNKQKQGIIKAQFNSLAINNNDPTMLKGKLIVHDFEKSWNGQIITEEVCQENMSTLIGKRVVCKYIPSEDNNGVDAITNHEEIIIKDRDTNNEMVGTDTIAIGFIENVYIDDYTDSNNNTKRVLYADVVIWNDDKYSNIAGLLKEWLDRGVLVHMSVEYLYCNYNVVGGVEYVQSPILYVAHTFLNSEQRGDFAEVLPSYDVAQLVSLNERDKWNKAVSQALNSNQNQNTDIDINNNSQKEEDNMAENKFYKALCELSFGDIKEKIMTALSKNMNVEEFYNVWLSNYGIYDTYFVYENYEDGKYVNYKVTYTTTETEVVVDLANKVQVERDSIWIEVGVMETQLNSLNEKINELTTSLNTKDGELTTANTTLTEKDNTIQSLNSQIETLTNEKVEVEQKFNSATDTIISLNAKVEEMKPIVNEHNKEQYEKALNEKKDFYLKKFNSVKAVEKFNTDEVQELIIKTLNENEEGNKAVLALNSIIVDLVPVEEFKTQESKVIKEFNSTMSNLIPTETDFESRYGL
jgi:hypothetical protein